MASVITENPVSFRAAEKVTLDNVKTPSKFDRFFDMLGKEYRLYSPRWKVSAAR